VVEIFACTTLRMSNKNVTHKLSYNSGICTTGRNLRIKCERGWGSRRIENVNWIFQRLLTIMMRMMLP